jgi:hypothetical protein
MWCSGATSAADGRDSKNQVVGWPANHKRSMANIRGQFILFLLSTTVISACVPVNRSRSVQSVPDKFERDERFDQKVITSTTTARSLEENDERAGIMMRQAEEEIAEGRPEQARTLLLEVLKLTPLNSLTMELARSRLQELSRVLDQ